MIRSLLIAALLALVLVPASALAAEPKFTMSEIEAELMCPTCQSRLDMSYSPAAERIRAFVDEKRQAGWTKDRVKTALVADFGPAVLAAPPKSGLGLLAWLVPALVVVGAALIVVGAVVALRRRRHDPASPVAAPVADHGMDARIDAALRDLDD